MNAEKRLRGWPLVLVAWMTVLLVTGCGKSDDLQEWVSHQRGGVQPHVQRVSPPQSFLAERYAGGTRHGPFDAQKLMQALARDAKKSPNQALIAVQVARPKEPLEAYPLDALALVGQMNLGRRTVALVRADDGLHQVAVGQYLGMNYGKVVRISAAGLELLETVQDATGEWGQRPVTLPMQGEAGK